MLTLSVLGNCGRVVSEVPTPTASLADRRSSQDGFRQIEEQWLATAPSARRPLEKPLTQFVQAHPTDGHSRRARLYLAWLNVQKRDTVTAKHWLDLARTGANGVDGDLLEIVEASLLIATGEPHRAYARLKPLEGRLLNADDRMLYFEQMLRANLAAERYNEALQQILNLATQSARRHRARAWRKLSKVVGKMPVSALEAQLRTSTLVDTPLPEIRRSERSAARGWLLEQIRSRLSQAALKNRDVQLAQRLLSDSPRGVGRDPNVRLRRLATQASLAATIEGRRLGLIFDLGNTTRRQHSVEVSSGIAIALRAAHPTAEARVSLHTQSIREAAEIPAAMEQLAGEGASLFVAGLDAEAADIAADFAELQHLPLILLHPESTVRTRTYVRVFGVAFEQTRNLLRQRLESQGVSTVVQLGSPQQACGLWGEKPTSQTVAPLLGRDTLKPGLLLSGAAACSRVALEELTTIQNKLQLGVGLASWALLNGPLPSRATWTIGVGILPWTGNTPPPSLQYWFEKRTQPPTWFEAMGHDIANIAQIVLPSRPLEPLRKEQLVQAFHSRVMQALDGVHWQDPWTSQATGFGPRGAVPRQFKTVQIRHRQNP